MFASDQEVSEKERGTDRIWFNFPAHFLFLSNLFGEYSGHIVRFGVSGVHAHTPILLCSHIGLGRISLSLAHSTAFSPVKNTARVDKLPSVEFKLKMGAVVGLRDRQVRDGERGVRPIFLG